MYYNGFRKKKINISVNQDIYTRVRRRIGEGSFSALVNKLLEYYLVKDKTREAIKYLREKGYEVTK